MNKIPVGETVRFAYRFTFSELGTIIGLIWVPMVAIAVLSFLPYAMGDMVQSTNVNPTAAGAAALRGIALSLVSILLTACINVAVVRQALGLRTGPALVHFTLGRAEFRLWGAMLLLFAVFVVLMIGMLLAIAVGAVAASATKNEALTGGIVFLIAVAGVCAMLFAIARLGFLLVPITVKEEKISFERGWTLTQGNFWRITAVLFFVTLPTALIFLGAFGWLIGPELIPVLQQAQHLDQQTLADKMQAVVNGHIATILGVQLIIAPFSVGLTLGAAAYAYKALAAGVPAATPQP
jgi:hypothetical protein